MKTTKRRLSYNKLLIISFYDAVFTLQSIENLLPVVELFYKLVFTFNSNNLQLLLKSDDALKFLFYDFLRKGSKYKMNLAAHKFNFAAYHNARKLRSRISKEILNLLNRN